MCVESQLTATPKCGTKPLGDSELGAYTHLVNVAAVYLALELLRRLTRLNFVRVNADIAASYPRIARRRLGLLAT